MSEWVRRYLPPQIYFIVLRRELQKKLQRKREMNCTGEIHPSHPKNDGFWTSVVRKRNKKEQLSLLFLFLTRYLFSPTVLSFCALHINTHELLLFYNKYSFCIIYLIINSQNVYLYTGKPSQINQRISCEIEERRKEIWTSLLSKQGIILEGQNVSFRIRK